MKPCARVFFLLFFFFARFSLNAESIRVFVKEKIELAAAAENVLVQLSYNDSVLIFIKGDTKFLRGIELELTAPQLWLPNQGSLALGIYGKIADVPSGTGAADIDCSVMRYEPMPGKIQTVYQIPVRDRHGLRTTPYSSVLKDVVPAESFPILFRMMPIIKGLSSELENMRFQLAVKPILSDEGTVHIKIRFPQALPDGSIAVLIDEQVIDNIEGEHILREGEHHLSVLSTDYRNENRRFIVDRGKNIDVSVILQDLTPLMIFEAPANAKVFLDNNPLTDIHAPIMVDPGMHEVRIQVSDYAILKTVNVQKGKTYRVAFTVDLTIAEE